MTKREACFKKFSSAVQEFGFQRSHADHSLFVRKRKEGTTVLVVYVDDIVLTGDDVEAIKKWKAHCCKAFEIKDLGTLKYFLGIEVAHPKRGSIFPRGSMLLIF